MTLNLLAGLLSESIETLDRKMFSYQPIQDGEYQPIRYPSNMVRPCVHAICHEGGWFLESFHFECTSFSWCFPSSWAPLRNTKRHLLCTFIYKPKTESNSVDSWEWSKQQTGRKQQSLTQLVSSWRASVDTVALFLFSRITFCITAYPFNCKALMGSGHFWHGRWFLLTFLTQFPWKSLFMYLGTGGEIWELTQRFPAVWSLWGCFMAGKTAEGQLRFKVNIYYPVSQLWPNMDHDFA